MIRIWSQFIGVLFIAFLAGGSVTGSFFNDVEGSNMNVFGAFNLDTVLVGEGIDATLCSIGGTEEVTFELQNVGGLQSEYSVETTISENENGVCDLGILTALLNDGQVYEGTIDGFNIGEYPIPAGEQDVWRVKVKFPVNSTSSPVSGACRFNTAFLADQISFMTGQAFFDVETISHSVVADAGSCVPPEETVNLRMDKHISGDSNGFTVDQFSYHIIGDGIDAVVPHGGLIALPIGTYSIEELVPEGFVKTDWRIGWYGECESGSTFTTSVTIDDGNIDHGVLDCQADNQYRPVRTSREEEDSGPAIVLIATTSSKTTNEGASTLEGRTRESRTGSGGGTFREVSFESTQELTVTVEEGSDSVVSEEAVDLPEELEEEVPEVVPDVTAEELIEESPTEEPAAL